MDMRECKEVTPLTTAQCRRFKLCSKCEKEFYTTQKGRNIICAVCLHADNNGLIELGWFGDMPVIADHNEGR